MVLILVVLIIEYRCHCKHTIVVKANIIVDAEFER